jgi:hypothetical protein
MPSETIKNCGTEKRTSFARSNGTERGTIGRFWCLYPLQTLPFQRNGNVRNGVNLNTVPFHYFPIVERRNGTNDFKL